MQTQSGDQGEVEPPEVCEANGLLRSLGSGQRRRLLKHLDLVPLATNEVLFQTGSPIRHVYFPLRGVVAHFVQMENDGKAEVGMIGREGMVSVFSFLGFEHTPFQVVVQNEGMALRMQADLFCSEVKLHSPFHYQMLHYAGEMLGQVSQSAACNSLHSVEKRYCRWLLMTHDRVGADTFTLKQEFVGMALGVRRMTITPVAQKLRQARVIRYVRGQVEILDRERLEARVCECYHRIKALYASPPLLEEQA